MANCIQELIITHDGVSADIQNDLYAETGLRELATQKILKYVGDVVVGRNAANVKTRINAAKASGTFTLASMVATNTVTINGVVFTCVASGATGNQFNVGGTDALTATALAAAINASVTALVVNVVTAAAVGAVVTVTAVDPGLVGNSITIANSANGTASGARLTGGTNGDTETTHYFGSGS
jgi:phage tail sheath gpL-like